VSLTKQMARIAATVRSSGLGCKRLRVMRAFYEINLNLAQSHPDLTRPKALEQPTGTGGYSRPRRRGKGRRRRPRDARFSAEHPAATRA
jgi:hypothetical protein